MIDKCICYNVEGLCEFCERSLRSALSQAEAERARAGARADENLERCESLARSLAASEARLREAERTITSLQLNFDEEAAALSRSDNRLREADRVVGLAVEMLDECAPLVDHYATRAPTPHPDCMACGMDEALTAARAFLAAGAKG